MTVTPASGRTTSRAAQAAETRQRVIDAATQLFSERGYDDVAASDIAKAAGVAHGLPFHYFGSKRGIWIEVMHRTADDLNRSFTASPDMSPGQQLRAALGSHLEYLATHRGLALRLVLGGRGTDPEAWEMFEAGRWRSLEWLGELLGLDPQNAALRMTGRATVGALDEATAFWLQDNHPFSTEAIVDMMIQMVASGLRAAAMLDPGLDVEDALHLVLESS